jgi:CheY-like chemotaxis protein
MTKILLVEDDKSLREIYGVRLLAEGFDIVSAGDGEEALAMAIKEKPTLIISDVMMPKISGFDMLDILRSTTETRDIKVIMMTALSSEDQRARGEQLGADRYLVKSQVGIEDVVRTVHEVLGDTPTAGGAAVTAAAVPAAAEPAAVATDTPVADTPAVDVVASSAAPGNDGAGPLPPQPSELKAPAPVIDPVVTPAPDVAEPVAADLAATPAPDAPAESTLPQPTAPFSSPRPANLGEQVVHPEEATGETAAPETPAVTPNPGERVIQPLSDAPAPDATPATEPVVSLPTETPTIEVVSDTSAASDTPATDEPASESSTTPVV